MKKILFVLLISILLVGGIKGVNAETLSIQETEYYFYRIGKPKDYSGKLKKYYINNTLGYCIEPGQIEEGEYNIGSLDNYGLTDTQKRNIKLYAYYGIGNMGHENIEYYAAAQSLIWKEILGQDTKVIFSSKVLGGGTIYNIEPYENELRNLAAQYDNMPSVVNQTYTVNTNEEVEINDYKNVLERYEVVGTSSVTLNRNKMIINKKDSKDETVTLRLKPVFNKRYVIYTGVGQDMLMTGDLENLDYTFNIKVNPGSIKVIKSSSDEEKLLEGATYGIYDENDELIDEITTDENGEAIYDKFKQNGKYYLKELTAPEGYELDTEEHEFELTDSSLLLIKLIDNKIIVKKEEPKKKEVEHLPSNPETYDISTFYILDLLISCLSLIVLKHLWNSDKIIEE